MKYLIIIISLLVQLPVYAHHVEKPLILDSIIEDDKKRETYAKQWAAKNCPSRKEAGSFMNHMKCTVSRANDMALRKYPKRGRDEYCMKHYAGLSDAAAKKKLDELNVLKEKTRFGHLIDADPGELNYDMVQNEIRWLKKALKLDRRSRLQQLDAEYRKEWKD